MAQLDSFITRLLDAIGQQGRPEGSYADPNAIDPRAWGEYFGENKIQGNGGQAYSMPGSQTGVRDWARMMANPDDISLQGGLYPIYPPNQWGLSNPEGRRAMMDPEPMYSDRIYDTEDPIHQVPILPAGRFDRPNNWLPEDFDSLIDILLGLPPKLPNIEADRPDQYPMQRLRPMMGI